MRKKKTMLIALCLMGLGIIMAVIGFASGGKFNVVGGFGGFKIYNNDDVSQIKKDLSEFKDINIDVAFADVQIIESDKNAIDIKYNDSLVKVSYEIDGDILRVEDKNNSWSFFKLGGLDSKTVVKVYVKSDTNLGQIVVNNKSGNLGFNGINANAMSAKCDFGTINISDVSIDDMEVKAKSGEINLENLSAKNLNIDNDFGDINGNGLKTEALNIDAKAGDINLEGKLKGRNNISSDFGTVNLSTYLNQNDYSYDLDVKLGSIELDQNETGTKYKFSNDSSSNSFNVDSKSGDVRINFIK